MRRRDQFLRALGARRVHRVARLSRRAVVRARPRPCAIRLRNHDTANTARIWFRTSNHRTRCARRSAARRSARRHHRRVGRRGARDHAGMRGRRRARPRRRALAGKGTGGARRRPIRVVHAKRQITLELHTGSTPERRRSDKFVPSEPHMRRRHRTSTGHITGDNYAEAEVRGAASSGCRHVYCQPPILPGQRRDRWNRRRGRCGRRYGAEPGCRSVWNS